MATILTIFPPRLGTTAIFEGRSFNSFSSYRVPKRLLGRQIIAMTAVRRRVKVPEDVTSAPSQKTVKVAQTLYRKTGNLLLQFRFQISNQLDAEIWVLFFPALLALVLEPVQVLYCRHQLAFFVAFFIPC